ncbi:exodeoxyribonuclease III [Puccinia sorghi]|uniref:DNA-(apurinic or apyrimidinic site) endonuclease n=1 Tax=Puccinia sorghi TaxID=27349 RepID=A0A0L6V288_9BASI|nr:exodeoxyribonuclease III [Puccinia sorghi]
MPSTATKKKTTTKRKTEDQPNEPATSKAVPAKKAKGPTVPLHAHLPNNRTFPSKLEFPAKNPDSLRISAWNVCGINACEKKGLKTYLEAEDPDIIVLSETKIQAEPDIMHIKHQFKYRYWGGDETKGYGSSGVAILSKHKPLEVVYGLPTADDQPSTKGRMIMLEFSTFFLIGTYTPNAGDNLKFMNRKIEWNVAFEKYLRELDAKKPVVWGGDINCALSEKDIRNAASNWNKTAGYTQQECDGLNSQLSPPEGSRNEKLVDVWRELNPDLEGHYTSHVPYVSVSNLFFLGGGVLVLSLSYRFGCREKGIGWRIDSFIVSPNFRVISLSFFHSRKKLMKCDFMAWCVSLSLSLSLGVYMDMKVSQRVFENVKACEIRQECYGASDHVPVIIELAGLSP